MSALKVDRVCALAISLLCMVTGCAFLAGCHDDHKETYQAMAAAQERERALAAANASAAASSQTSASQASAGAADLGVPIYPGAVAYNDGLQPGPSTKSAKGLIMALFETPDAPDRVIAYYVDKLVSPSGEKPSRREWTQNGHPVVLLSAPQNGNGLKTVGVHADEGKTIIEIMNVPSTESGGGVLPSGIGGRSPSGSQPADQPSDASAPR